MTTCRRRVAVPPAGHVVLECFAGYRGHVSFAGGELLRGLVWMLSLDPSDEATALLGKVAITAATAGEGRSGRPVTPQTAASAIDVLATRSGPIPARTLLVLSPGVRNKALLGRVHAALHRLSTTTT